jgi:hypothetical protein
MLVSNETHAREAFDELLLDMDFAQLTTADT